MLFDFTGKNKRKQELELEKAKAKVMSFIDDARLFISKNYELSENYSITTSTSVNSNKTSLGLDDVPTGKCDSYKMPEDEFGHQVMFSSYREKYGNSSRYSLDDETWDNFSDNYTNPISDITFFNKIKDIYPLTQNLPGLDMTFSVKLKKLMSERKIKASELYQRAQIDKGTFSRIVKSPYSNPAKDTVITLALGLQLSLEETNDLLSRAGYALSHSNLRDVVIEYCFIKPVYDVVDVNCLLNELNCKTLGRIIH